ncbi:MAG TPA: class I SAM-dependent methyltransferase [Gemmatimonadaceae bacterium]
MSNPDRFSYDDIADDYARGVDSAPYNALYERPATLSILPDVRSLHILDAGCGPGWYAEELLKRGARLTAVDASPRMLAHARQRLEKAGFIPDDELAAPRVALKVHDLAEPLDFIPDGSVDGVLSPLVLHYLRDWRPTLREFARVLRPNGWLVLSTHHPATEAHRFATKHYFDVELVEDTWKWLGKVRLYRRPLTEITESLIDSGFVIELLREALPTDEFRLLHRKSYDRILRHPDFLHIRARLR